MNVPVRIYNSMMELLDYIVLLPILLRKDEPESHKPMKVVAGSFQCCEPNRNQVVSERHEDG